MRSFLTFFLLFTPIFFLAPAFCLPTAEKEAPPPSKYVLPERIVKDGEVRSTADLILENLAAQEIRGYHPEALKAAAVAATTRLTALWEKQGNADGYPTLSPAEAKKSWGDYAFSRYWPELQAAVEAVWGEILIKDGALYQEAAVFPLSWGKTEAGTECPYDHTSNDFETAVTLPLSDFTAVFPQYSASLKIKNAQSGRVESVTSGDVILSGWEVMERFSLPSPAFTLSVNATNAVFRCKGRGDGRGMSLYGANERAKIGEGYREILEAFYPDASVQGVNRSAGSR